MILLDKPITKQILDITNNFVMLNKLPMYHIETFAIENSEVVVDYWKYNSIRDYAFEDLDFDDIIVAVLIDQNDGLIKDILEEKIRDKLDDNSIYVSKMTVLDSFYAVTTISDFTFRPYDAQRALLDNYVIEKDEVSQEYTEKEVKVTYEGDERLYEELYEEYGDSLDETPYKVNLDYHYDIAMLTTRAFVEAIFKNLTSV